MTPPLNPLVGVAQVGRGKAEGLARFGATPQAFLASLAPLIAFPFVGALIVLFRDGAVPAFALLAMTVVAQLAPPVLSHALAERWGRGAQWLHYATAYNWCYWAIPVMAVILLTVAGISMRFGLSVEAAAQMFFVLVAAYSLWLHWFLARHGLGLSGWRSAVLVALINGGTLALAFGPRMLMAE